MCCPRDTTLKHFYEARSSRSSLLAKAVAFKVTQHKADILSDTGCRPRDFPAGSSLCSKSYCNHHAPTISSYTFSAVCEKSENKSSHTTKLHTRPPLRWYSNKTTSLGYLTQQPADSYQAILSPPNNLGANVGSREGGRRLRSFHRLWEDSWGDCLKCFQALFAQTAKMHLYYLLQ